MQPVLDFFNTSAAGALTSKTYQNIVSTSASLVIEYNLSMWYVNKAYGILANNSKLPVKKLCDHCFGKSFKVFNYPF